MTEMMNNPGRIVIVCYRPKSGKADELRALMRTHLSTLRAEGLVTDRKSILMQAADETVVEVFEWVSGAAIEDAHSNPAVQALWAKYEEVADYVPISEVSESKHLFSEFAPLDID